MNIVISVVYLLVSAALVSGCGESDTKGNNAEFIRVDTGTVPKKVVVQKDTQEQPKKIEIDPRQKLLEEEFALSPQLLITHSLEGRSADEQAMLRHLVDASRVIGELYMLQIHPKNLEWWQLVQKEGTEVEKRVFLRNQMPWCIASGNIPECCALSVCPKKEIAVHLWPDDMTDVEYNGFAGQINGKEIQSSFTLVSRSKTGGFDAIPFSKSELLGKKMAEVAKSLKLAAEVAPDPSLRKFLESRSSAFISGSPFPYDQSDYDWIAVKGDWEVTVGPYETYQDPRGRKAFFQMYFGRIDDSLSMELDRVRENLQGMEDALARLVGEETYKSRKLDPRIKIRVVDVWDAAGEGRSPLGVVAAYHLPNAGKAVDEGLYKKVLMVNHMKAFGELTKLRARLILGEGQQKYFNVKSDIMNTALHELAHGFGAYSDMSITKENGKRTTVMNALGQHEALLEELKADVFGKWLIRFQKDKKWLSEEEVRSYYVSGLMHMLGLLQYPLPGLYSRMVAVQLGWYMDEGGVVWDADSQRFAVDFEKIPSAIETLSKKVALIQLTGDLKQAKELIGKYIFKKGEEEYQLKGTLAKAREVMVGRFKKEGAKSPTLRYEITGL